MALRIVNAGSAPPQGLMACAAALPPGAPIIVMIHGYRFCPTIPEHDPHRHILALEPAEDARRALSWPRALGLSAEGDEGLGIAFGWSARGALRAAYRGAEEAGADLAALIAALSQAANRPVAIIGHSLGARVALAALRRAEPGQIGRLVLLSAAEFRDIAEASADSPAGRRAEILNITSRENDPFDFGLELMLSAGRRAALGMGLSEPRRNWLDIQIDDDDSIAALRGLGFDISDRRARACHWSPYLRDGMFDLYRVALGQPWALPLALLRGQLPVRPAPRWSRLLALPQPRDLVTGSSA